jgi:predicted PurR-regulated permease PerM
VGKDGSGAAATFRIGRRRTVEAAEAPPRQPLSAEELAALNATFAAPGWLRDLGRTAWLLVGLFALLLALVWFLGATYTIGGPVVLATIVAVVAAPVVSRLTRHMPRALAAVLVLVGVLAIAVLIVWMVVAGITSQHGEIAQRSTSAADKVGSWFDSTGADKSGSAGVAESLKNSAPKIISTLLHGVINGISGLASVVFMASLALLSVFFLLKDGPPMRAWVDRHIGVPLPVARTITGGVIRSLRGYFKGVTIVAAFNGIVVGIGALLLGVPLAGTIAVVTFVTAYVPFIGAFVAGTFAVVIALGAKGTGVAIAMLVIVILANGLLQNLLQPFAMGSALDLHPLVVLVATIASGCIFGTLGLILAAPLLSAAVHITRDLAVARAQPRTSPEPSSAAPTS